MLPTIRWRTRTRSWVWLSPITLSMTSRSIQTCLTSILQWPRKTLTRKVPTVLTKIKTTQQSHNNNELVRRGRRQTYWGNRLGPMAPTVTLRRISTRRMTKVKERPSAQELSKPTKTRTTIIARRKVVEMTRMMTMRIAMARMGIKTLTRTMLKVRILRVRPHLRTTTKDSKI